MKRASNYAMILSATAAIAWSAPSVAQMAAAEAPPQTEGFEDIIVTARRTEENLQDVPVSITAFSAADLKSKNIASPEDLNRSVPGLSTTENGLSRNAMTYTLRGQGQTLSGGGAGVVSYFNEVPTAGGGPAFIYDLASFEVLKGPQGTLFGRNTTGGAVLLTPQRPKNDFEGYIDLTYGNYNNRRLQAAINLPVVDDTVLLRFATDINKRDGYSRDAVTGRRYDDRDYQSYRAGLILRPLDGIENYTSVNYSRSDEREAGIVVLEVNPNFPFFALGLTLEQVQAASAAQQANGLRRPTHDFQDGSSDVRNLAIDNITTIELSDNITLKNIVGYRRSKARGSQDIDGTPLAIVNLLRTPNWTSGGSASADPSSKQISEELQFSGKALDGKLHWTVGGYYEKRTPNSQNDLEIQYVLGSNQLAQNLRRETSKAVYGQFTYDLTDQLKFTAGGRYTWDSRKLDTTFIFLPGDCEPGGVGPNGGYCNLKLDAKFKAPTWNVNLQYSPSDDTMVYIASRHGYKSGGFNPNAPTAADQFFGAEYITDIELGAKTQFEVGGVKARINGDIYRGWFKGKQETGQQVDPDTSRIFTITKAAGKGIAQGIELEGTIIPAPGLEFSGFYAFTDVKFTENLFNGVDYSDLDLQGVTRHKASGTVRYEFLSTPNIGDVSVSATYSYQSSAVSTLALAPLSAIEADPRKGRAPGYGLLNLRADWNEVGGLPLDLSVFATNVTNKTYYNFMASNYNSLGFNFGSLGQPRFIGVQGRYRF